VTLEEEAIIDPTAAEIPKLAAHPLSLALPFCPAAATSLALTIARPSGDESPSQVTAGEDLTVSVRALDAYDNLCDLQECTFFIEAEGIPLLDETLTSAGQLHREPPQRYLVQLSKGEVSQRVPTRVAGELWIRLLQPSAHGLDTSATKRVRVTAASAISVDVVNIPEQGHAGVEFEIVVRALDQFGNVDDTFERDVSLACDGPDFTLPNQGVVSLTRGLARMRVQRADFAARLAGQSLTLPLNG